VRDKLLLDCGVMGAAAAAARCTARLASVKTLTLYSAAAKLQMRRRQSMRMRRQHNFRSTSRSQGCMDSRNARTTRNSAVSVSV